MPSFRVGVVSEVLETRPGLQRVLVDLGSVPERAYVLTQLIGSVAVDDRVVVNTTAVDLGLGTGGWHVVHWNLARETWTGAGATAGSSETARGSGMKLRYTSLQVEVENAESVEAAPLGGMPVVAAGLHSQIAAIAAAFKQARPRARLVYVMTDGGALPIAISDLVWQLRARELIDATVTCGHAFGGDFEAVSVHGALAVARHVAGGDAAVVAMGPGSAGTASRLGFSGIEVGPVLDAATTLHGRPIAALRVSFADPRPRHQGVSHHSITVLSEATHTRVRVPVPCVGGDDEHRLRLDLAAAGIDARHEIVDVTPVGAVQLLAGHALHVESMGRPADADPVLFEAGAAAGVLAARDVP
ncbi:MAG TPA: DUF3866 family protein [Acidimicrobiia bacterium]